MFRLMRKQLNNLKVGKLESTHFLFKFLSTRLNKILHHFPDILQIFLLLLRSVRIISQNQLHFVSFGKYHFLFPYDVGCNKLTFIFTSLPTMTPWICGEIDYHLRLSYRSFMASRLQRKGKKVSRRRRML